MNIIDITSFNVLTKYKNRGEFRFTINDDLKEVCNSPTDKSGVYIVFAEANNKRQLIYIGRSGRKKDDTIIHRNAGLGGIKDRIVNGHQFGKIPRRKSWPLQMAKYSIERLNIWWFDTQNDDPIKIEYSLLVEYQDKYSELPIWNKTL